MFAFFSITSPDVWITEPPWKRAATRNYLEQGLAFIELYHILKELNSMQEFYERFQFDKLDIVEIINDDTMNAVSIDRKHFPAIRDRLNKNKQNKR